MKVAWELCPVGQDASDPCTGDVILCHRKGLASKFIRAGEAVRYRQGDRWSHMAYVIAGGASVHVIEALTHGVKTTPLSVYHDVEYVLVRTSSVMSTEDRAQATAFAESCVGQHYGFSTDLAIALRYLTPGHGLWFGMNGTEMCSGLCCQALVRSWFNFSTNPAAISPSEAAIDLGLPKRLTEARMITHRLSRDWHV